MRFIHYPSTLALIAAFHFIPLVHGSALAQPAQEAAPQAEKSQARDALVKAMNNMTLSILQDNKKAYGDREATLERGFVNMVDIGWIARFVLGSAWRTATDRQRERYTELYSRYLTKAFIATFAQNAERKISDIKILGILDVAEDKFTARTEVLLSDAGRLKVDYMVKETPDSNRIVDITIENVSLLSAHRAEFSKIASSRGIDGVINTLEQLVRADKPLITLSMK